MNRVLKEHPTIPPLLDYMNRVLKEHPAIPPLLDYMNRVLKEHPTIPPLSALLGFIIYLDSDITGIEKCTQGQSANPTWMKYRKSIKTTLSFHRISRLKGKHRS